MVLIRKSNPVMLPALLNPKPLLDQERPSQTVTKLGGVNEAYDLLKVSSKYFKRMTPASRSIVTKYTYPNHEPGKAFPTYPIQFE